MVTVGFRDIYRYGVRFFGYFLVVGGLAAAFLGGGAYLASQEMALLDPSLSALSETRAFVGVSLMGIGAVLGTVGFFGLAHKLLTESLERAVTSQEAEPSVESAAGSTTAVADESATGPESESDTGREPDLGRESEPEPAPVGRHPDEPPEPVDEPAVGQPTAPEPVDDPVAEGAEPADSTGSTEPATEEGFDGDSVADDGPFPEEERPEQSATGNANQEWTPPDPSEFDAPSEPDPDPQHDTGQPPAEPENGGGIDPDEVPDDETLADQGVESFESGGEDDPLADRLPSSEDE